MVLNYSNNSKGFRKNDFNGLLWFLTQLYKFLAQNWHKIYPLNFADSCLFILVKLALEIMHQKWYNANKIPPAPQKGS